MNKLSCHIAGMLLMLVSTPSFSFMTEDCKKSFVDGQITLVCELEWSQSEETVYPGGIHTATAVDPLLQTAWGTYGFLLVDEPLNLNIWYIDDWVLPGPYSLTGTGSIFYMFGYPSFQVVMHPSAPMSDGVVANLP